MGTESDPIKDMTKILINLISECNAVDIFTPQQIESFIESRHNINVPSQKTKKNSTVNKARSLVGKTLLKYQSNISLLREKHKKHISNLEIKDHRLLYAYPQAVLMDLI